MPSHILTLQSAALGPEESQDAREMPTGVEGVQEHRVSFLCILVTVRKIFLFSMPLQVLRGWSHPRDEPPGFSGVAS